MQVENSVRPFFVTREELTEWTHRPHQHNFFELVYIEKGSGKQCINHSLIPFAQDNIFLLPPYDCHWFELAEPATFIFIRFNALFFRKDSMQMMDYTEWFQHLHYILSSYNRQPGDIIHNTSDKHMLISLIRGIYDEYTNKRAQSDSIIRAHMFALLNILRRNFEQTFKSEHQSGDKQVNDILQYIQFNLFDNEKLRVESLAAQFNLSPKYVSEYFRKKTGENLKEYILKSRVNVAQSRLQHSDQSAKEIAYELGFTDASHMAKVIRKYYPPETTCTSKVGV
ncbi:AraC family transcriptional regulator [Chitinophaga rhizophila]|uniref:AraC family transcriptional regulator n=1 Tax=Chitinophaga rhizophila TaxID=2866212 RepID=A0ABS7GI83_9BACT|nr:AraC family transcriptional regulator [Chitinophaga rhizophila]MBW8687402.1 AraC family transcriptional regulator [Chitinophaga rhizophila]